MISHYPLIPQQAFLYFPPPFQLINTEANPPHRIIFDGGLSFQPHELAHLQKLTQQIQQQNKYFHLSFYPQPFLLRFLQANQFDAKNCIKALKEYKKWEDSILPLTLKTEIEEVLGKGMFYLSGRDHRYRPIIVVNVPTILALDMKEKLFFEAMGFFFQFVIENCLIEGQVETWITIIDLGDVGMFSLGGTLMDTISFLSNRFRCRLHHSYLLNCPSSIKFIWGMVQGVLKEDQIKKLTLLEEGTLPSKAFSTIHSNQIQFKYGGSLKNLNEYWPLKAMKAPENCNFEENHISVKEYNEAHEKGLLKNKKIKKQLLAFDHPPPTLLLRESERQIIMKNILRENPDKMFGLVPEHQPSDIQAFEEPPTFGKLFGSNMIE